MCSNIAAPARLQDEAPADLAARLGRAIDELAASISRDESGYPQLAERLARAWAMITGADPEVASRTARY
jgi:hypothetical protein